MAYPTVENAKTYLSVTGAGEDTEIGWFVDAATAWVENYCGHNFEADADQTIYILPEYPALIGRSRRKLLIREYEIISVTSITNGDGETVGSGDYLLRPTSGPPYYMIELDADAGLVWWRGSDGAGVVTIVASSLGYSATCPDDVFLAILETVGVLYRARATGGLGTVTTATRQGLIIQPGIMPPHILFLLNSYRRRR